MATLLLKTEPDEYSFADLVRDGRTSWTGVTNAQARAAMRAAAKGDVALIYHTGGEKRIVGLAKLVSGPHADPDAEEGDDKSVAFDLAPVKAAKTPVTLAQIKGDKRFAAFALVRQSRLSVMSVPDDLAAILREMAGL